MEERPDTRDPLRALEREIAPPAALEGRVRSSLAGRGLLRRHRSVAWRRAGALAAAVALFAGGYLTGHSRRAVPTPADGAGRYALFLYEDATFDPSRPEAELVAEYSTWAAGLRALGQLEAGEQLAGSEQLLERRADSIVVERRGVGAGAGRLTGFFVILARSEAEALRIAGTCPHLSYGGRIAVRAIVGT